MPILGLAGPWLRPVRVGQQGLAVFVFHDVTDQPSPFSCHARVHVSRELFLRQLSWIQERFTIIHPRQIEDGGVPPKSALLTFDDGWFSFRDVVLPILEAAGLPATVFLNMDVVEGAPKADALAVWLDGEKSSARSAWESLGPVSYRHALQVLEDAGEFSAFQDFQGKLLDEADIAALDGHPLIAFGNHLSNHWYGPSLTGLEFEEALMTNQHRLQPYQSSLLWLAHPFGVGTPPHDECADSHGFTRVFTGTGLLNPEPNEKVLHRVDLNGAIRNRPLFRWRLSARTALASLQGLHRQELE